MKNKMSHRMSRYTAGASLLRNVAEIRSKSDYVINTLNIRRTVNATSTPLREVTEG
jgi:hypothetical protein